MTLFKAHPDKKRSAEEYDEMNKSNKITIDIVIKILKSDWIL